ncbi:MAG: hypothetical protein SF123_08730 [Chloroflexota bacterium]|nr:hypothetical protein [Chloroflexota bacterium]
MQATVILPVQVEKLPITLKPPVLICKCAYIAWRSVVRQIIETTNVIHALPKERLHPSLRDSFVSLPGNGTILTPEQLDAIFGGDRRALRDIAKLVFQMPETDHNTIE